MKEKEFRRNMAVFPIGSVMKLTDLSARQIRYYEDQELIKPDRNEGNRRMYSLNDMDRLLEIKDYISEGLNIAATPPITPALLFLETFVIMVNMVQIGTTTKVTQKASWNKVFNRKKRRA